MPFDHTLTLKGKDPGKPILVVRIFEEQNYEDLDLVVQVNGTEIEPERLQKLADRIVSLLNKGQVVEESF